MQAKQNIVLKTLHLKLLRQDLKEIKIILKIVKLHLIKPEQFLLRPIKPKLEVLLHLNEPTPD